MKIKNVWVEAERYAMALEKQEEDACHEEQLPKRRKMDYTEIFIQLRFFKKRELYVEDESYNINEIDVWYKKMGKN